MTCFLNFFSLFPDRAKQLQDEAKIDSLLKLYRPICPSIIAEYYAHRRQVNRDQFDKVEQASILDKYSLAKAQMEVNEAHQQHILSGLSKSSEAVRDPLGISDQKCDPCQFLAEIISTRK